MAPQASERCPRGSALQRPGPPLGGGSADRGSRGAGGPTAGCAAALSGILLLAALLCAGCLSRGAAGDSGPSDGAPPGRAAGAAAAEGAQGIGAADLTLARAALQRQDYVEAGRILRDLGSQEDAARYPEVFFLQARLALGQGDAARAGFYLKRLLAGPAPTELRLQADALLGDISYAARDYEGAFRYYLETVNHSADDGDVPASTWLRLAEIALLERHDEEAARSYLRGHRFPGLSADEQTLLQRLLRRLRWRALSAEQLGLNDPNISALLVDGDDLWVGSWNGGVARYSLASGVTTVFKAGRESLTPNTVRCMKAAGGRVWIGTYQGLFAYSKPSSHWQEIEPFGGGNPKKVEALEVMGEAVFAGTLGDGLWLLEGQRWRKLSAGALPGDFINCLLATQGQLWMGTITLGVIILDPATGAMQSFDAINPGLEARNIVMLLPDGPDTIWIGTYGEGLYRWRRRENRLEHFSKASGELSDDWVLCGARADSGSYFGTFGGGVCYLDRRSGRFRRLGLRDGLGALDISCAAYSAPELYFGTLGSGLSICDESLVQSDDQRIE